MKQSGIPMQILLLSSEPYPFREKHRNEFQKRFPEIRVCLIDGEMCSWYGNRMLNGLIYLNQQLSEWQMMQNLPKPKGTELAYLVC